MTNKLLLFAVCGLLLAGAPRTEAQIVGDDLKNMVGFIFGTVHGPDQNGIRRSVNAALGTGFFVFWPDPRGGADWGYYYFVTAKHVLKDTNNTFLKTVRLRLNLLSQENERNFDYLDLPVSDNQGNLIWLQDQDDPIDEAVAFPVLPDQKRFKFRAAATGMFVTAQLLKDKQVAEGDSVMLVGLLPQFYGNKQNFPVVRKGSIALLSDEPLPTPDGPQHGYICEVASWPGSSGSPVFLFLGGMRRNVVSTEGFGLLGIVISYYNNSRSGETTDTATVSINDPSNIGLAFILPASQITKILSAPLAEQVRDKITAEHNKLRQ